MCGIIGKIASKPLKNTFMQDCLKLQSHRGPDASDSISIVKDSYTVELGHNRLSIIDLDSGSNQPMSDEFNEITIVFNGEIYNFQEIRKNLEEKGYVFKTQGDTEVLLKSYQEYGLKKMLDVINGMFSFVIWDNKKEEIYLVRDRFGKKPLYYYNKDNIFMFSSEIKCIKKHVNLTIREEAIEEYFTYLYIPYPRTIYNEILQVEPATYKVYNCKTCQLSSYKYWKLEKKEVEDDYAHHEKVVKELLLDSIEKRLISDRDTGVFLSGGLDSSIISALAVKELGKKINTYSIGYSDKSYKYDESYFAQLVAKDIGSTHKQLTFDTTFSLEDFKLVIEGFDQPFGNPTAILTHRLTKEAKEEITVGLIGDGADEIFLGYPRQKYSDKMHKLQKNTPLFIKNILEKSANLFPESTDGNHFLRRSKLFLNTLNNKNYYYQWSTYFNYGYRERLLKNFNNNNYAFFNALQINKNFNSELQKNSYLDIHAFMTCNLLEAADKMSMQNSFELRAPFIDYRLVEAVYNLPDSYKINNGETKHMLRNIGRKILPEEIFTRPKRGFNPPINVWMNKEMENLKDYFLNSKSDIFKKYLNLDVVLEMIALHMSKKMDLSTEIWSIFIFIYWFESL